MDILTEAIGILATIIIFIGFIFKDINRVRVFNIIGSLVMIVYGIKLFALSTIILNAVMIALNTYMLVKAKKGDSTDG